MRLSLDLKLSGTVTVIPDEEPTLEPNVWPQPDFDDSAGLTLTETATDVEGSDGVLAFLAGENGPQICAMTTPPVFAAGDVWHYTVTAGGIGIGNGIMLEVGGAAGVNCFAAPGAILTGTITVPASPTNVIRFREVTGFVGGTITAFTLQREA